VIHAQCTFIHFDTDGVSYLYPMLQKLQVKNYAIIDEVTIVFSEGLNIITGETGAGKSILLGALGLVLGDRADMNALYKADKKCIIEAEFLIKNLNLQAYFETHELDYDDHLILRRELLPSLRSRAFINDTPVTIKLLQQLSEQLINVHRQFATLDIFRRDFQTKILDTLAKQQTDIKNYSERYRSYLNLIKEKDAITERLHHSARENDFLAFQINEIYELELNPTEDIKIPATLKQAEHADEIQKDIQSLSMLLTAGEENITSMLEVAEQKANDIVKLNSNYQAIADRIHSAKIELEDIASELDDSGEDLVVDQETLAALTKRFDALQRLYFKHQVDNSSDLSTLLESMEAKIKSSTDDENRLSEIEQLIQKEESTLKSIATKISKKRSKQSPLLKEKVEAALSELAMSNAIFEVDLKSSSKTLGPYGFDEIDFTFSANPGSTLQLLQQVASGGELSRLSLAMKSIIAHELALPTMVFDEIDSGVSGDTALRMGHMLRGLGTKHQTIVITHSPQVAAQGTAHYFVSKAASNGATKTAINALTKTQRKEKIAIMLSSDPPTKAAIANATELLKLNTSH